MKTDELEHCPSCGMDLALMKDILPQLAFCTQCRFPLQLIAGKYRLEQRLAEGGFGEVYQARHILLRSDAYRAVKVLKSEFVEQPQIQERFFREVQLTSTLSQRNEHIIRIYDDFGKDETLGYYYVMEYLQGLSLAEMLKRHNNILERDLVLHLFRQLCRAMQSAHNAGIVHRDLKPDNLFLIQREKEENFLKVLDFGIAKPITREELEKSSLTKGVIGTPAYISPEQCQNIKIDARADIYSMGALLYKLLTGQLPFPFLPNESPDVGLLRIFRAHIVEEPLSPKEIRPDRVSQEVEDVVLKALAKRPEQRFGSADAFIQALEQAWSAPVAPAPRPFKRYAIASTIDGEPSAPIGGEEENPATSATMDAPASTSPSVPPKPGTLPTPETPSTRPLPLYSTPSLEGAYHSSPHSSLQTRLLWGSLFLLICFGLMGGWIVYQRSAKSKGHSPPPRRLSQAQPRLPKVPQKRRASKAPSPRIILARSKVVMARKTPVVKSRPRVLPPVRRVRVYPVKGCPSARPTLRWLKLVIPRGPNVRPRLNSRHKLVVRKRGRLYCIGLYKASHLELKVSDYKTCKLSLPFQHGIYRVVLGEDLPVDEIDERRDNYCLQSK